tara:strand:+ start:1585 stop:3276 length:1692 start_codon:yes stop_codon:yes gene_type:complete
MKDFVYFDYPLPDNPDIRNIWEQISTLRHEVYASELQQYQTNAEQQLEDPGHHFIVCLDGKNIAGYISLNPPEKQPFRLNSYFSQAALDETVYALCGERLHSTYEVRALTVSREYRGHQISTQLMAEALKFVLLNQGTDIIAMGHANVAELYKKIGMEVFEEHGVQYGETYYYPMYLDPQRARKKHADKVLEIEEEDDVCYHGGKSWDTSKFDFKIRDTLVVADVLDSPFPPCPEALHVLREQLERCCQESPPTQCEELIETIANTRDIHSKHVAVSSGSSSLMFSFLPQLLTPQSKVLVLSPMYGEYSHILTHVIGCEMTNFVLHRDNGFVINADELVDQARQHDAVLLVNPNSPTGVYCDTLGDIVHRIQDESQSSTRCRMIWVDETYIDYIPEALSLESHVADIPSLIVCKSMSKCYALSGLRVAYAVSQKMTELRRFIPPWAVSLPGQLAAVAALKNPTYYNEQYAIIHQERMILSEKLREQNFSVLPGVANFILTFLPEDTSHTSSSFIEACKEKGVFIRDAQNMGVTLGDNSVRFAIRSSEENLRIVECVKEVLGQR